MFADYEYLKSRLKCLPEIKAVYRVRDRFSLDELLADIRNTEFPCIAVEVNNDGMLDLTQGNYDKSFHTFHVLLQPTDRNPTMDEIEVATSTGRRIGRDVIKLMQSESHEVSDTCYGLDVSNIRYSNIGPIGMQCYGCTYNYVMNRDNEA